MEKKVLVYGWYGHANLGDEAFKAAFKELWKNVHFTFTDRIPKNVSDYNALWVGGGSFVDQKIPNLLEANIPLGFIGIGIESTIHPDNMEALQKAKIVVVRDKISLSRFPTAHYLPDLVYSRDLGYKHFPQSNQVTILLNSFLTPRRNETDWKSLPHPWFTLEFAKVCDHLMKEGYFINFVPMCTDPRIDDRRAAAYIVDKCDHIQKIKVWDSPLSEDDFCTILAKSKFVISQRLHGIIFSHVIGTPFVSLNCHDKMKELIADIEWTGYADYYGFTETVFKKALATALATKPNQTFVKEAMEKWKWMSGVVEKTFSL